MLRLYKIFFGSYWLFSVQTKNLHVCSCYFGVLMFNVDLFFQILFRFDVFERPEVGDRFVFLEDCCHAFEVSALDKWVQIMTSPNASTFHGSPPNADPDTRVVRLPECPQCKTPIRCSQRYGTSAPSLFVCTALIDVCSYFAVSFTSSDWYSEFRIVDWLLLGYWALLSSDGFWLAFSGQPLFLL